MLGYLGLFLQFNLPFHVFIRNFHHMFESVLRCVWVYKHLDMRYWLFSYYIFSVFADFEE